MDTLEKIRVMLPHWIEHNQGHGKEFSQWENKLAQDNPEIARLLHDAVHSLQEVQGALEEALEKAGGALEQKSGTHSHGAGHHHH